MSNLTKTVVITCFIFIKLMMACTVLLWAFDALSNNKDVSFTDLWVYPIGVSCLAALIMLVSIFVDKRQSNKLMSTEG